MADSYNELKELSELGGTLNLAVSEMHRGKRPPSMSESWAFSATNVERAQSLVPRLMTVETFTSPMSFSSSSSSPSSPSSSTNNDPSTIPYASLHILVLSFLFHITLVSIFETLFFFAYVSTLEDAGILKVVAGFTGTLLGDCERLSPEGREIASLVLKALVNETAVEARGAAALTDRDAVNHGLLVRAWTYVAGISVVFVAVASFGLYRRLRIPWRTLVLENCGLVVSLGVFEAVFFTTIVYPYLPVTGPEIAGSLVADLNATCGV